VINATERDDQGRPIVLRAYSINELIMYVGESCFSRVMFTDW